MINLLTEDKGDKIKDVFYDYLENFNLHYIEEGVGNLNAKLA